MQMNFAPVKNGRLYFEDVGAGYPLLLIHAGVADSSMWDEQVEAFSRKYRVVRFDCRGSGLSHTESVEFSNRQDVLDLMQHLGIEKAVLLGLSRGGQIALDFALEHPERVSALVLAAAGVSGFEHQPDGSARSQIESEMFNQMDMLWEKGDLDALNELEVRLWVNGPGQPAGRAPDSVRQRVRKMNRATYQRQDGSPTPIPLEPAAAKRLAEVSMPVLILVGDLDTTATLAMADFLVQHIPASRKLIFAGAAHMLNMEIPDRFNQAVLDFLAECRLAG